MKPRERKWGRELDQLLDPSNAATISVDVPCAACRYDLRGLHPEGRCPECGMEIAPSLWVYRRWQLRDAQPAELLAAADSRWVRQLAFGAGVSVLVFALMLAMSLAPDWAYAWKSPPRRVMLGIACTMWVLSCYAAWKLAAREPRSDRQQTFERPRYTARRRLRVAALLFLSSQFVGQELSDRVPALVFVPVVLALYLAGAFAAWLYWWHVSYLIWRLGARRLALQAKVLGVLASLTFLVVFQAELDGPGDSLYPMLKTPTPPYGTPAMMMDVIRWTRHGNVNWFTILYLACAGWALFISLWLFVQLLRSARAGCTRAGL